MVFSYVSTILWATQFNVPKKNLFFEAAVSVAPVTFIAPILFHLNGKHRWFPSSTFMWIICIKSLVELLLNSHVAMLL